MCVFCGRMFGDSRFLFAYATSSEDPFENIIKIIKKAIRQIGMSQLSIPVFVLVIDSISFTDMLGGLTSTAASKICVQI